ncbi:uncharacterized protein LAJ45_05540 [Morchella importuna]|uniref:uncharacterized protein n=1 Tax=Morchella importuna TaxID=1174673 RepID=UPI001E8E91A7|nr:uncharacterized protein LAJ45_05540 [Morchella importuna]KAH8150329.1 hypothetical protein LAJ45_05540 [Morchella importuna]
MFSPCVERKQDNFPSGFTVTEDKHIGDQTMFIYLTEHYGISRKTETRGEAGYNVIDILKTILYGHP